jgi:hypothetical protein
LIYGTMPQRRFILSLSPSFPLALSLPIIASAAVARSCPSTSCPTCRPCALRCPLTPCPQRRPLPTDAFLLDTASSPYIDLMPEAVSADVAYSRLQMPWLHLARLRSCFCHCRFPAPLAPVVAPAPSAHRRRCPLQQAAIVNTNHPTK